MLEDEECQLQQEIERLQAVRNRIAHQRCEIFFLKLPEEDQRQIESQAEREKTMSTI